jgi:hypothetical protein
LSNGARIVPRTDAEHWEEHVLHERMEDDGKFEGLSKEECRELFQAELAKQRHRKATEASKPRNGSTE